MPVKKVKRIKHLRTGEIIEPKIDGVTIGAKMALRMALVCWGPDTKATDIRIEMTSEGDK